MSDVSSRRDVLLVTAGGALATIASRVGVAAAAEQDRAEKGDRRSLAGVVGITTGGLNYQRENRKLTVFTLPKFVRDDLGMQLIDLNTRWLESYDESYVQRVL